MSEIIKQSMADIWASIGDVVAPDVEKIAEGWLVELVPRQYWNWMQNRTDTNLAYLFQHGIPEWDATVEYIVNKSYVTYADVVYKAILTGTNKIPSTQPTYWKVAFATSTAALEALKALTPAADKLPYYTGATTAATTTITSLARTLLDDTTQAAMLTTIGAQPVDATLTALAGVTTATNKLPYFSGVDTAAVTDLTAFGRSLIDDADAAAARTTLGLGTGAVANITTSATDTTANQVLKVGDFGIGTDSQPTNIDPNTVRYGSVMGPVNQANAPTTECIMWSGGRSGGARAAQFAVDHGSPARSWIRSYNAGRVGSEWGQWVENWDSGNTISLGLTPTTAKTALSLQNVDNTSDANKPVSTAQQTALNLKAPLSSPSFTGSLSTPVIEIGSQSGASNAFIDFHTGAVPTDYDARIIGVSGTGDGTLGKGTVQIVAGTLSLGAGGGAVTAPTPAVDNSTTSVATTAFVAGQASSSAPTMDGVATVGTSLRYARADHIHPSDTSKAPLVSPALTGTPTAPTAAVNTNTTQLATTAFVNAEIANDAPTKTGGGASGSWGISVTGSAATLAGLTPTVAELNYVAGVTSSIQTQLDAKAPLASPTFTGTTSYASLGLGATAVDIDTITGNGVITNVSASTTGTFNGFQGKTGTLITYTNGTRKWQMHNPGDGYLWFRAHNGTAWRIWAAFITNDSPYATGGSVSFSGSGSISILKNSSGLSVTRNSAGNYTVNGAFGLAADQPAVAISNNGRVILSGAASAGGVGFVTYPYNTATATDSPYVCVILGI